MATTVAPKRGESALIDLREFLGFLGSLWGILATVTVLFPLSNVLVAVLPLPPGSEGLSSVLATLFSLFAIFLIFVLRNAEFGGEYSSYSGEDIGSLIVLSLLTLGCGIAVLVVYSYVRLETLAAGVAPVLYAGVFGLFTAAFTFLALAEYVHSEAPEKAAQHERAWAEGKDVDDLLDDLKELERR